jgi:hypothetical protein
MKVYLGYDTKNVLNVINNLSKNIELDFDVLQVMKVRRKDEIEWYYKEMQFLHDNSYLKYEHNKLTIYDSFENYIKLIEIYTRLLDSLNYVYKLYSNCILATVLNAIYVKFNIEKKIIQTFIDNALSTICLGINHFLIDNGKNVKYNHEILKRDVLHILELHGESTDTFKLSMKEYSKSLNNTDSFVKEINDLRDSYVAHKDSNFYVGDKFSSLNIKKAEGLFNKLASKIVELIKYVSGNELNIVQELNQVKADTVISLNQLFDKNGEKQMFIEFILKDEEMLKSIGL